MIFLWQRAFFSPPLGVLLIAAGAPCCHTLPISMLHNFVWRIIMVMMMMEVMMIMEVMMMAEVTMKRALAENLAIVKNW